MRVGLIGWATRTGIGQMNRDMWDHGLIHRWLVPMHPVLGVNQDVLPKEPGVRRCGRHGDHEAYHEFLGSIDVLLFVEHDSFVTDVSMVFEARQRGLLVCCIPMMEWLPLAPWVSSVDVMWAVTRWTHDELQRVDRQMAAAGFAPRRWKKDIIGGRWGVDLDRFQFRERSHCKRFLFVNGQGGVLMRKGADVVARAAAMVPWVPISFRSQAKDLPPLPPNVQLDRADATEKWGIYEQGDVLIAPSRWEGLGLQHYEAQACGLPIITTDAPPMTECDPIGLVRCAESSVDLCGRRIAAWEPDPRNLAKWMRGYFEREVNEQSRAARAFVEKHHNLADVLDELCGELQERHEDGVVR